MTEPSAKRATWRNRHPVAFQQDSRQRIFRTRRGTHARVQGFDLTREKRVGRTSSPERAVDSRRNSVGTRRTDRVRDRQICTFDCAPRKQAAAAVTTAMACAVSAARMHRRAGTAPPPPPQSPPLSLPPLFHTHTAHGLGAVYIALIRSHCARAPLRNEDICSPFGRPFSRLWSALNELG